MTNTEVKAPQWQTWNDDDRPRPILLLGAMALIVLVWWTQTAAAEAESQADRPETAAAQPAKESPPRPRRILFFTADWCGPCQVVKGNLKQPDRTPAAACVRLLKAGWTIGPEASNHIQVIDADQHAALVRQYRIGSLPSFVLIDHGQELGRLKTAELTARQIAQFYLETDRDVVVRNDGSGPR